MSLAKNLNYALISFKKFYHINEEYKKASSNTKGVLHELLVGYHMRNKKHMEKHDDKDGDSPKAAHDKLKNSMHPDEYKKINARAKASADHIHSVVKSHGHTAHDVHWTSKPGDIHRSTGIHSSQKEDSSDIVVHAKDKSGKTVHHGVSLKVSDANNKHVPVSNPGMSSMHGAEKHLEAHKNDLNKSHPALKTGNAKSRKDYIKSLPSHVQSDIKAKRVKTLHKVIDHAHNEMNKMPKKDLANHIRNTVLQAHKTPMQNQGHNHIRHVAYETNSGTQFHHMNPNDHYHHILNDHDNITTHKTGTSIIFKHKGKPFAKHRAKFAGSDPHSSIKGSGEPM